MIAAWILRLLFPTVLAANPPRFSPETPTLERIFLPEDANRTIRVNGLRRAALANPKVARARAVPPDQILLTAKSKGKTSLRTWASDGSERAFLIQVGPANLTADDGSPGVVKVDLEFLELDASGRRETGVRWPELISANATGLLQGAGGSAALSYTVGLDGLKGWLQQLVEEGRAKLLANPQIYVRLAEEAVFSSGGEIPVPTTSETFGRLQRHVEWKSFGMNVKVRPQSLDGYHLHSDIHVDLSEINAADAIGGIPALNRRRLSTKVNSIDGETILLSGLVRRLESAREQGIPVLKELPIFGPVFSSRSGAHESHEVMMAVTFSMATRQDVGERWEAFEEKFEKAQTP